jgi:hypothetical protein
MKTHGYQEVLTEIAQPAPKTERWCIACKKKAEVYAGGRLSGDWADWYCIPHIPAGWDVFDRL